MHCKLTLGLVFCALSLYAQSQTNAVTYNRNNVADILGFEVRGSGNLPTGWSGGPAGTIAADDSVVHSGHWAVRLDRSENPSGTFSTVTSSIPVDFTGKQIELRGFLRTKDVGGFAGLWVREDGEDETLEFDNMQRRQINGTREWEEYSVTLPLNPEVRRVTFGVLLAGSGVVWGDDLQLLVDEHPVREAQQLIGKFTETDHEFDNGSGVQLLQLTELQIDNLATLARIWGFLKYHHPAITFGSRRWDYDLFRILPGVLHANSSAASNALLLQWIDGLGPVEACKKCVSLEPAGLKLKPDLAWIDDAKSLGLPLSQRLQSIYRNRVSGQQYYVSIAPQVGNPVFHHESEFAAIKLPDSGFQLLALFRLWNIVEYWAPDRDVVGEDWFGVLREFIPRVALAAGRDAYGRAMMAAIAEIHDTHANLWSSLALRPPVGECRLPVDIRFVDRRAIVTGYTAESGKASGLERGDEIVSLDGMAVSELVAEWTPLYADSNEAARLRDMARTLTNGACGPIVAEVLRGNARRSLATARLKISDAGTPSLTHDVPGPTFRLLSNDVAYLKLSSVKAADVPHYIESAKGTRGLIVDIRNYPSEFVVFALGSILVRQSTSFVTFTAPDLSNPGAFYTAPAIWLTPAGGHYDGKVVILVDEVTQSSAEYTAMALRSTPNAVVVGSDTAGADGNVSAIPLPGGLRTMVSGLGVFYPDGSPTQRVGIHVDVVVRPTIGGIRAGRDEVLESAIRQIIPETTAADVERMARP